MEENQQDPERKMWSIKGKQYMHQLIARKYWASSPFDDIDSHSFIKET